MTVARPTRRVLILSPYPDEITKAVIAAGDFPVVSNDDCRGVDLTGFDLIVSFGYRYIIKDPILSAFAGRILNLHVSFLPWGRGADPNFWAWRDGEPHGVTLHLIDAGVDTGPVVAQRIVSMTADETLATSYAKLRRGAETLFAEAWPIIDLLISETARQPTGGSHHYAREAKPIIAALPSGYDTPVAQIRNAV